MAKDSSKTASAKTTTASAKATTSKATAGEPAAAPAAATVDYTTLPKTRDVQAFPATEFDFSKLVIYDPVLTKTDAATFYRSKVGYVYPDNTVGPAVFSLSKKYCYGVQADNVDKDGKIAIDKETGKEKPLKGYRAPMVITGKDPTDEDELEAQFFEDLQTHIQNWGYENRAKFGKITAKKPAIDAMVPYSLWRKKNPDGSFVENSARVYYCPLKYYVKDKRCDTVFYDINDNEIDPLSVKSHCWIVPTICIDNLFLNSKALSGQMKLYDATVELITQGPRKRLATKGTLGSTRAKSGDSGDGDDIPEDSDDEKSEKLEDSDSDDD